MAARPHLTAAGRSPLPAVAIGACAVAAATGTLLAHSPALGMALLLALCFLPVTLLNVPAALSCWLVSVFLAGFPHMESVPNRVLLLVGACWVGLVAARRAAGRPALRSGAALLTLLALFTLWQAGTLLWAPDPHLGKLVIKSFLYVILACLIVLSTVTTPRHARWLAAAYVAGAVVSVLWGIADGGMNPSAGTAAVDPAEGRFQGGSGDPNYLAAVIVPAIMLAGGLAARPSPLRRLGLVVAVAVLTVGLAATESRGGILALAAAALTALAIWRGRRLLVVALLGVVVIGGGLFFAASPARWDRITSASDNGSGSGRKDLWRVAWRMAHDHPLGGVGVAQFSEVSPQFVRQPGTLTYVKSIVDEHLVVHNVYLQLWAEVGLIGLGLFLALAVVALRAVWRATAAFSARGDPEMEALARATFLAIVGFLVASSFLSNIDDRRIWVLFAFAVALAAIASRQPERPAVTPA